MALSALVGITGIYLRQIEKMGVLGLIGYLIYGAFFLLVIGYSFIEVFVLPQLADDAPRWVSDSLALFANEPIEGDLGPLKALNPIAAVMYLFGGLLFGIALYRARILARWASVLLAAGTARDPPRGDASPALGRPDGRDPRRCRSGRPRLLAHARAAQRRSRCREQPAPRPGGCPVKLRTRMAFAGAS